MAQLFCVSKEVKCLKEPSRDKSMDLKRIENSYNKCYTTLVAIFGDRGSKAPTHEIKTRRK